MTITKAFGNCKSLYLFTAIGVGGLGLSSCDSMTTTVTITAEEFRFSPKRIELPAHQTVRIILRNLGQEKHVFGSKIMGRLKTTSRPGGRQASDGILINPGQQVEMSVVLDPGLYPYWCQIRGHRGMQGILIVG